MDAIESLRNGATDYVLKTNLVRLPAAVERALQESEERAERHRTESELQAARERLSSIFLSVDDVLWSLALPEEEMAKKLVKMGIPLNLVFWALAVWLIPLWFPF